MTRVHSTAIAQTLLVVFDGKRGPSATQKISFERPFSGVHDPSVRVIFNQAFADSAAISRTLDQHRPDALVLSRVVSDRGSDWIRIARSADIPVIFHIDDDLLAVPSSLGKAKYDAYNNPERLNALRDNIESSDLLYVSTGELAKRFAEHGIRTPIAAGDIYCSVSAEDIGALIGPSTGPVIGYMGTSGHSADLAHILPAVCEVMDAVPSLQFEVFGTIEMPSELERFGRRTRHLAPVADYSSFIPHLRSLGWWVGLAPLEDTSFNRCKADTKWVEYSLAGMAVVASDLPVYRRGCDGGGGMLARTPAEWTSAVMALIHRPDLRRETIAAAQNKLRKCYTHDQLRRQVIEVVEQVLGPAQARLVRQLQPEPASGGA